MRIQIFHCRIWGRCRHLHRTAFGAVQVRQRGLTAVSPQMHFPLLVRRHRGIKNTDAVDGITLNVPALLSILLLPKMNYFCHPHADHGNDKDIIITKKSGQYARPGVIGDIRRNERRGSHCKILTHITQGNSQKHQANRYGPGPQGSVPNRGCQV